ncbi:MAG: hypothetical protein AAB588_00135 [Patescibacteria group bacterium]
MNTPRKKVKAKYAIKLKHFPVCPQFGSAFFGSGKRPRKKVNFMVNMDLLEAITFLVPSGSRSEFVNEAVEEALRDFARRKAIEAMDEFRRKNKWKMTDEEIRKAINYGRK